MKINFITYGDKKFMKARKRFIMKQLILVGLIMLKILV